MRFGLHSGQHQVSMAGLRDLWRHAAAVGFDACYLFDHFQPLHSQTPGFLPEEASGPDGPCLEGFTALAVLARQVERVGVGMMVASAGYRQVAHLGSIIATLNQAAPGRLEIGIGAGWFAPEYRSLGIAFPPPRERLRRLEATLEAIRAWWGGEPATVEALELRDLPIPPIRPLPRLWIAGTGERVLLRLAARYADSWNAMFLTPGEFAHKGEVLAGHCEAIGRPLERLERSIAVRAFCSHERGRAVARMESLAALRGRDPDAVRARSLVGTPDDCAEQIRRYQEAGATHAAIMVHPPYDLDELTLLAAEVFPRFR